MNTNANVGQLIKSLTFEVEAVPQDNAIMVKNTQNMTPLNVKVRVRKKEDGPSFVRKGIIAVPRLDQPNGPVERLRLASSDQTIMSFNMLMEADLERKVPKKSKRSLFGICLGVQGDDDDVQYLPSASNLDKDSRSDTGVAKLKNVRTDHPVVADDTSSSVSSTRKDKIFGKCKPGGCLDPPFGEDKYAYQPQQLRHKAPATKIDDSRGVDFSEHSSNKNIKIKKKKAIEAATTKDGQNDYEDKSVLNLFHGKAGTAVKENDSELLITYPSPLSTSQDKNIVRRVSDARQSRKSFNEFSTEYFSPPRTPRESKDCSKSDKGKHTLTKEILAPGQTKLSLTDYRQDKSEPKDLETLGSIVPGDVLLLKRASSHGLTSELLNDLENKPNEKARDSTAATLAVEIRASATGLIGLGVVTDEKKDSDKPKEGKEKHGPENATTRDSKIFADKEPHSEFEERKSTVKDSDKLKERKEKQGPENTTTRDSNISVDKEPHSEFEERISTVKDSDKLKERKEKQSPENTTTRDSKISVDKEPHSEFEERISTVGRDTDTNEIRTLRIANVPDVKNRLGTIGPTNVDIPSHDRTTISNNPERNTSTLENALYEGNDLVFHGVDINEDSERHSSQVGRPIHDDTYKDLASRGMATTDESEIGLLSTCRLSNLGIDSVLSPRAMANTRDSNSLLHTGRSVNVNIDGELSSRGMTPTGNSEGGLLRVGKPTSEGVDNGLSSRGMAPTSGSERGLLSIGEPTSESIVDGLSSRGVTATGVSKRDILTPDKPASEGIDDLSSRGMTPAGELERGILHAGEPTGPGVDDSFSLGGIALTHSSETSVLHAGETSCQGVDGHLSKGIAPVCDSEISLLGTGKPANEGVDDGLSSKGVAVTGGSKRGRLSTGEPTAAQVNDGISSRGVPPVGDPNKGLLDADKSKNESVDDGLLLRDPIYGSERSSLHASDPTSQSVDDILSSKGLIPAGDSERAILHAGEHAGKTVEDYLLSKGMSQSDDSKSGHSQIGRSANDDLTFRGISTANVFERTDKSVNEGIKGDLLSKRKTTSRDSERISSYPKIDAGSDAQLESRRMELLRDSEGTFPPQDAKSKARSLSGGSERGISPLEALIGNEDELSSEGYTLPGEIENGFSSIEKTSTEEGDKEINRSGINFTPSETGINEEGIEKGERKDAFESGNILMEKNYINGNRRHEKRDASVSSAIFKSPSDIIFQYRDNKALAKSPVIGVDIQPTEDILEQAGRKLSGRGSDRTKEGPFVSAVGVSAHDATGSGNKGNLDFMTGESHADSYAYDRKSRRISGSADIENSTEMTTSHSRGSVFLNLAFQTYLEDNEQAIKTLDSTKHQDQNNVVHVKSVLKYQDKRGITVPIDSKYVMNIQLKPTPVQKRKSNIPKPISMFDTGKIGNSTALRDIGSDPHAALSVVFHQELVPLESIIKSLKEDIDSLAAQQMMLTDRLGQTSQRIRPAYGRKCGCLKRFASVRPE